MITPINIHRTSVRMESKKTLFIVWGILLLAIFGPGSESLADRKNSKATFLTQKDFRFGTYIIDKPGIYRLKEDISFNPNSPDTLTQALRDGTIPPDIAAELGLPNPVDAYHAGFPLFTQFAYGAAEPFNPGGPLDPRYDPKAFGLGFFAAIVIRADNVILDLNGHTIEQSPEHALLQRFFAVIETANQPFITGQGPADFGPDFIPANHVVIKNGTIGRSAHHGIHGNGNTSVKIKNIDFVDYEVSAVALNGVQGLTVKHVYASNRKDVPVLGTFSSVQFIKPYVESLYRRNSYTELIVNGVPHNVEDIRSALRSAVNNVHADIIASPKIMGNRAQIDKMIHPDAYRLFHNPLGVVDGNSYSFLVNAMGVAVDGFPFFPSHPAEYITFSDVHVDGQTAFINEIVALNQNDKAVTDPVGAVFQIRNLDPDTGHPITMSSLKESEAYYTGNVIANAQAFVAKAYYNGEFDGSPLDLSRLNITPEVLMWVEGREGYETLDSIVSDGQDYLCNGDSMFHVNKGVIAFKMDAARYIRLRNTSANDVTNLGYIGSHACGDYGDSFSHPKATLPGYGGARTRAYSFAGSHHVTLRNSQISGLKSSYGSAIGVDIFTDATNVRVRRVEMTDIEAGMDDASVFYDGPNALPQAVGIHIGEDASAVRLRKVCADSLVGIGGEFLVDDWSEAAWLHKICR